MSRRRKGNRKGKRKPSGGERRDGTSFWGDPSALPTDRPQIHITDDPPAVPRSLGEPPLPGHREVAEHYFAAIYDRAVATAGALATAAGLIDPQELVRDE